MSTDTTSDYVPFKPDEEVVLISIGGSTERRAFVIEDRRLIGHRRQHVVAVRTGEGEFQRRFETRAEWVRRVAPVPSL